MSHQLSILSAADAPLVTICMICKQIVGPGHRPLGTYVAPGIKVSHGLCRSCAPGYLGTSGLSVEQTAKILSDFDTQHATRNTKPSTP